MSHAAIVAEHVRWMRAQRWTPPQALAAIGWVSALRHPGWDTVITAYARAYEVISHALADAGTSI